MISPSPVWLHIGLSTTGMTFLQGVLDERRATLAAQGLLYPGSGRDHRAPARDVLQLPVRTHGDDDVRGAWLDTVQEAAAWPGSVLISHVLFSVARPDQVRTVVGAFSDRPVEVIVTASDLASQLTADWQEAVTNGAGEPLAQHVERARRQLDGESDSPVLEFRADLAGVLETWALEVPPERLHLVSTPSGGSDPLLLWTRFAEVLGVELSADRLSGRVPKVPLGAVETEFLRRLNADLGDSLDSLAYHAHVKHFLAQRALLRFEQSGPIVLSPAEQAWAAAQSRSLVQALAKMPLTLHGDLTDLVSQETPATSSAVTDEAVVEVGVRAIAQLLRRMGREQQEPASGRPR